MYAKFNTNKLYFREYYTAFIAIIVLADVALYFVTAQDLLSVVWFLPAFYLLSIPNIYLAMVAALYSAVVCFWKLGFEAGDLLWILAALAITFVASALLHNAAHSSFRPRWLNRVVGEAMGLFQLVAFPSWVIVHILHHRDSDDPVLDPHPPLDKPYWEYLMSMRQSIVTVFTNYYFKLWGTNEESIRNLKTMGQLSQISLFVQSVFWFLLLGPQVFTYFFVVSVVFKMAHFAWFNYATHVHTPEGTVIENLDKGFYKVINFVAFGLYFHKNHHLRPHLFDPGTFEPSLPQSSE